jgi:hypothetical protein
MGHKEMTILIERLKPHVGMASLQTMDPTYPLMLTTGSKIIHKHYKGTGRTQFRGWVEPWLSPAVNNVGELYPHHALVCEAGGGGGLLPG